MTQHKKVIHVKDLVIKADNVIIERRSGYRDPIFGMPRGLDRRRDQMESRDEKRTGESGDDDKERRRPFSWI